MKVVNIIKGWYFKFTRKNDRLCKFRMSICDKCEFKKSISASESICSECGCFLDAKCRVVDEKCINGKW